MGFRFSIRNAGPYLMVTAQGRASLEDMFDMIDQVTAAAARFELRQVLVDQREVEEDFKFTDHFALGAKAVAAFRNVDRAASLVRVDRRSGTSEKVAQKKGVQLRVFTDEREAVLWLTPAAGAAQAGAQ